MKEQQEKLTLILVMTIFGTIGIFVHYINMPTPVIALSRGFIGSFFLLALSKYKKENLSIQAIKKNFNYLLLSGILIGLSWLFLFEAYKYTSVAIATLCCYLAPIFMMLASPFITKEKLSLTNIICIFVALLGMVFISGIFEMNTSFLTNSKGIFLGILSAICYAAIVFINKSIKNISANDMTIVQLFFAGLVFLPYIIFNKNTEAINYNFISILFLLILGVVHTGYAYTLYFKCVASLKTQIVAIYGYIDPIVAIIFSTIVLRQKMSFISMIGAALILGSTLFSEILEQTKKRKNK